jgi:hypothetical protein
MVSEMQEPAGNCTETAQGYRMPGWLVPYKNDWASAGKICSLVEAEGTSFRAWFADVKPRLRAVSVPSRNGPSTKFLVKQVWAFARAHGLRLIPTDRTVERSVLLARLEQANLTIAALHGQVATAQAKATTQAATLLHTQDVEGMMRLLAASTEPRPAPGVYFLLDPAGGVMYVGQSKSVLGRMAGHADKVFATVKMIPIEAQQTRLAYERKFITFFRPPLNVMGMKAETVANP